MLLQVHWQHRLEYNKTIFVAQGEFKDGEGAIEWANKVTEENINDMPEEYSPMICTEDSPYFIKGKQNG